MKKLINMIKVMVIATVFVIANTTIISAQSVEFGARFMPTFSQFDVKTSTGGTVDGTVTLGYGGGIFLGYHFTNNVGIQAEVIYSSINQKYSELDIEKKVNLKYVNIPLLLLLETSPTKAVNLSVVAGPQIGISVGSSFDNLIVGDSVNLDPVLSVKKGDLGLAYGAGLDFGLDPANKIRLGLGFRGVYGLIDISDNNNAQETESYYVIDKTKIKTYSVYLGLSILF
jgi:hypothetical protein